MVYTITRKGRAVLRSATMWGLSRHLRDLLALCDPQVSLEQARQFLPPESLQIALFSLQQLELIEGPPTPAPKTPNITFASTPTRINAPSRDSGPAAA